MRISLRVKVIGLVILTSLLLSATGILLSYRSYTNTINDHYKQLTLDIAKSVANTVDVKLVEKVDKMVLDRYVTIEKKVSSADTGTPEFDEYVSNFKDIAENEDYKKLCADLLKIQSAFDCESAYLMYPYEPDQVFIFVGDGTVDDPSMPGAFDNVSDEQAYIFADLEGGYAPFITNYKEYGYLCSAAVPVYGVDGRVIAEAFIDISMTDVMKDCHSYLNKIFTTLGLITILLIIVYILIVEFAMVRPINAVAKAADSYINDTDSEIKINQFDSLSIHTGDEIENLANAIKRMSQDIVKYIGNLTKVTAEKERIGTELTLAKEIQANTLPNIFPPFPDRKEFELYATMNPAKEVGGDFYDFFLIDDDHLGLVMADVSGKGVPAALFMMISKALIKNQAGNDFDPASILTKVNKQLCENNKADMFVTVWLGILEISTGKLTTSSAGHEYPAICRAGGDFELFHDKHGIPLGAMDMCKYKDEEIILCPGDVLYVYTDGVPEANDLNNVLYGTDRMLSALNAHKGESCTDIIEAIKADIDDFAGEAPQFDDVTMLVLKYN